jgi:hypothetical protein
VSTNPKPYKDIIPSLVFKVTEHELSRDFDYHRIQAPWVQVNPQNFKFLGANEKTSSEYMYEIILECMKRVDNGINPGHAIIYQCIRSKFKVSSERNFSISPPLHPAKLPLCSEIRQS